MVNKAKLIERIAELARDKKIEGITDIKDESDREGMRIPSLISFSDPRFAHHDPTSREIRPW